MSPMEGACVLSLPGEASRMYAGFSRRLKKWHTCSSSWWKYSHRTTAGTVEVVFPGECIGKLHNYKVATRSVNTIHCSTGRRDWSTDTIEGCCQCNIYYILNGATPLMIQEVYHSLSNHLISFFIRTEDECGTWIGSSKRVSVFFLLLFLDQCW